eukprot:m.855 g.855  ORF g.855 m.855 type:complete len:74 (-) comp436_c0_seq1:7-228(-)
MVMMMLLTRNHMHSIQITGDAVKMSPITSPSSSPSPCVLFPVLLLLSSSPISFFSPFIFATIDLSFRGFVFLF